MLLIKSQLASPPVHITDHGRGFSLIELMVTLVIGTVLVTVAVPQYNIATQNQRSNTEITNLLNDLQLARSEALKEGQFVSICTSSSGTACTSSAWNSGWIVYSNPTWTTTTQTFVSGSSTLLRVQPALTTKDTIVANPSTPVFTYNRDGFGANLTTAGVLFTLHNSTTSSTATRCIWLDITGHQYVQKYGSAAANLQQTNSCT